MFEKKACGIEITEDTIRVIELEGNTGDFEITAVNSIPRTAMKSNSPQDLKKIGKEIAQALSNAKPRPIKVKKPIIGIHDKDVFLTSFELEKTNASEDIIQEKAINRIPFKPSQIVGDYEIVAEEKKSKRIVFAAANKEKIENVKKIAKSADISLQAIDIASNAECRALHTEKTEALIVNIDKDHSIFSLCINGSVYFSEISTISDQSFVNEIVAQMNISEDKAQKLKEKHGMALALEGKNTKRILENQVGKLVTKIEQITDYHKDITGNKIEKIILNGHADKTPYLKEFIHKKSNVSVEIVDPLDAREIPSANKKEIQKHISATVIGLAMRGLQSKPKDSGINLL